MNTCAFCGAPSTLLCDGRIYDGPTGSMRVPQTWFNGKTCDAHVCRACAKKIGDVHICASSGCRWDSRDLCPECQKVTTMAIPIEVVK